MIQDLEQKMDLIKEIADRNAQLAKHILTEEQVEAISTLIGMSLIEYDAHVRAIESVRKFKLDDSFKKAMEEAVVSDTPAVSWMDAYRGEYDALLKSGMFFEFHPSWTGEWDKDKYAFCHDRKYKKLSPQDPVVYSKRDNTTIEDIHDIHREMLEIEETDEEAAYRKGYMDGYDEGLYDGMYK